MVEREEGKFYADMTREKLIGYSELHCETERGLFHKSMVAQMIEYAGRPERFISPEKIMADDRDWYAMGEPMSELVGLARKIK